MFAGDLALVGVKGRGETLVRILKRNPKTYKAELEDGTTVTGEHRAFRPAPASAEFNAPVTLTDIPRFLDNGTVVRFKRESPYFKDTGDRLYVSVAASADGGHRLFQLGGSTKYWRKVRVRDLEIVPVAEINR